MSVDFNNRDSILRFTQVSLDQIPLPAQLTQIRARVSNLAKVPINPEYLRGCIEELGYTVSINNSILVVSDERDSQPS